MHGRKEFKYHEKDCKRKKELDAGNPETHHYSVTSETSSLSVAKAANLMVKQ